MTNEKPPAIKNKRQWAPRIWEGSDFFAWVRFVVRHRFDIGLVYIYIAVIVTIVSFLHTMLRWLQEAWLGRRVARVAIREAPLFIIGHWRTGTTLLHEFLIRDARHNYPTTYECMEPNHFLLTEHFFSRWLRVLTPSHRPMDNMAAGFDRPQEDEFALCMLGQPSPYSIIGFPNQLPSSAQFLDPNELSPRQRHRWRTTFLRFLQQLTYKDSRRLILKSPPHSCRIGLLLKLFPDARFVHIVRDPYVVYPSTVKLWKSLFLAHGMHKPTFRGLEEYVYRTFLNLYHSLEHGKKLVGPRRFHEVRYEELVADPVGQMRQLYETLELGEFEEYRPRLETYLESIKGYETNRFEMSAELRAEIHRRWGEIIRQYGYEKA